jgi:hypothetical protein
MPAGYSGKPLYQKLGIKPGQRICVIGAPADYDTIIEGSVSGMTVTSDARLKADMAHIFETRHSALAKKLPSLIKAIAPDGAIWVSWPKKSSRVATDITEDVIRTVALPLGLVDVKVCAVNETWSALKLVIRRERR